MTPLGKAHIFLEMGVLPLLSSTTPPATKARLQAALLEASYYTLLDNVSKMAKAAKDRGGEAVLADRLASLLATPMHKNINNKASPSPSSTPEKKHITGTTRQREEVEGETTTTGPLRTNAFISEFTRQWCPPIVAPKPQSKDPGEVVKISEMVAGSWGRSPIYDALKGSLSLKESLALLKGYKIAHTQNGSIPSNTTHSKSSGLEEAVLLQLAEHIVLDGLYTMLRCGCQLSTNYYQLQLDVYQPHELLAAFTLCSKVVSVCGVPDAVVRAALHCDGGSNNSTVGQVSSSSSSIAVLDDVPAMNRWRVLVMSEFILELVFPADKEAEEARWLQLFVQRQMPVDVVDDENDDDEGVIAHPTPSDSSQQMQDSGVVSASNIMSLMETAPHRLPKDTVKQCRKDIFLHCGGGAENDYSILPWSSNHPYFMVSAWELEHHFTLAELQRFHGILKRASGDTWGTDPPPKLKASMAALLVSGRDTLQPLLLQHHPKE